MVPATKSSAGMFEPTGGDRCLVQLHISGCKLIENDYQPRC
jgi:hypothetical protein